MKKKMIAFLLTLCLCAACLPWGASAASSAWSAAYKEFIISGEYVDGFDYAANAAEPWDSGEKRAMLLDMDKDGTPELLISNGDASPLGRASYIYTYKDGQVAYIGNGPDYPVYYAGIPGIAAEYAPNGGADARTWVYHWKDGDAVRREEVYSCDANGGNVVQLTSDDELFRVCRAGGRSLYESGVNLSELDSAGWEAFVNAAMPDAKPSFTDIPDDAFYAAPVAWAVENGITSGTSSTAFGPSAACTRGQIVTFLWRAAGEPEPAGAANPFEDVKPTDYFYKSVLWAVENGITSGTDSTHFSPSAPCTRGQAVTFLWRAAGEPGNSLDYNPFKDVKSGAYYCDAVLWAAGSGITAGASGRLFVPESRCDRGQIVTFLYRHYVEPADVVLPVPEEEIYKSVTGSLSKAQTVQYDMDGDGTDELFVYYGETSGKDAIMFSIYTIRNDAAAPVIENVNLQSVVSAPSGGVGVVEKGGKRYLYTCGRNSGYTHPYTGRRGTLRLYAISGTNLRFTEEITYYLRVQGNSATPSEATITRKVGSKERSMSYEQYKAWVDSLTWKMSLGDTKGNVNAYF